MTLYLKYRPQKLNELDLTEVRDTLTAIIKSGNIPHAFLFSGPKGTGKTSAARILAKIVNCESVSTGLRGPGKIEPCNKCEQCVSITKGNNLDVIELDAASHRGIDDIRTLRDAVKLAPAKAKIKVYIIDEVHMLTVEASNALLKTLEEPPDHVMFILATTNPEKLLPTIKSRTTEVLFKKATGEEIARSLSRVSDGEKVKIDKETLLEIAKASDGSFRDSVKTLEQLISGGASLKKEDVEEFLFQKKVFNPEQFFEILAKRNTKEALSEVERMTALGAQVEKAIDQLLELTRKHMLAKVGIGKELSSELSKEDLIYLVELMMEAKRGLANSPVESLPLEIAIIKWGGEESGQSQISRRDQTLPSEKDSLADSPANLAQAANPILSTESPSGGKLEGISDDIWKKILETVKPINTSIEALLRAARPTGFDGKTLTVGVFYKFHKERLEDAKNRRILEDVVGNVLGIPARIVCILTQPPERKVEKEKETKPVLTEGGDKDIIKIAEEIFGN